MTNNIRFVVPERIFLIVSHLLATYPSTNFCAIALSNKQAFIWAIALNHQPLIMRSLASVNY
ncbi:hypothetical protein LC593_14885 [Nostoc sp. CHAB 5844]|nr:hypothetical protein [Nostoc sp. CHAB 5844]